VLNTSRQIGGAAAIAIFGGLATPSHFVGGFQVSLLIAIAVLALSAMASLRLPSHRRADGRTNITGARERARTHMETA
jgi:hypothetical protein